VQTQTVPSPLLTITKTISVVGKESYLRTKGEKRYGMYSVVSYQVNFETAQNKTTILEDLTGRITIFFIIIISCKFTIYSTN
jgi:hypothetical protein